MTPYLESHIFSSGVLIDLVVTCRYLFLAPINLVVGNSHLTCRYLFSLGAPINPVVVETLASLAYRHPHHTVPFLKAILSTTSHIMKVQCMK